MCTQLVSWHLQHAPKIRIGQPDCDTWSECTGCTTHAAADEGVQVQLVEAAG